jgi:hypothetical protein
VRDRRRGRPREALIDIRLASVLHLRIDATYCTTCRSASAATSLSFSRPLTRQSCSKNNNEPISIHRQLTRNDQNCDAHQVHDLNHRVSRKAIQNGQGYRRRLLATLRRTQHAPQCEGSDDYDKLGVSTCIYGIILNLIEDE